LGAAGDDVSAEEHEEEADEAEGDHVREVGFPAEAVEEEAECPKADGGAEVLEGVDDAGGEAGHFSSADVHGGGGAKDGVGGVAGEAEGDEEEGGHRGSVCEEDGKSHDADFDQIECGGNGGAGTGEELVGDVAGDEGAGGSDAGDHKSQDLKDGGFQVGVLSFLHVAGEPLIDGISDGAGAGICGGDDPDGGIDDNELHGGGEVGACGGSDIFLGGADDFRVRDEGGGHDVENDEDEDDGSDDGDAHVHRADFVHVIKPEDGAENEEYDRADDEAFEETAEGGLGGGVFLDGAKAAFLGGFLDAEGHGDGDKSADDGGAPE